MLRRTTLSIALILVSTLPVTAVSNPVITGNIAGVELCPQSICGAAVFAGDFIGQVDSRPARGVFWTGITHDPLPTEMGDISGIDGGVWLIRTRGQMFSGVVADGTLTNNGDNTFTVALTLVLGRGGNGTLTFDGILDHNPFPPTIIGTVSQ